MSGDRTLLPTIGAAALCAFGPVAAVAQSQDRPLAAAPLATIPNTQVRSFTSSVDGQEYDISVALPGVYTDSANKAFSVVYLLDANWDFSLVAGMTGGQATDRLMPPVIVVGIGWRGRTSDDYSARRMHDLTPTPRFNQPSGGNAPVFLRFIKDQVIPFVDSTFRTVKGDRTLVGVSLGGLFGLYTMWHEPGLFKRYVLMSPSLNWDYTALEGYDRAYVSTTRQLPVRVFLGIGALETGHRPLFDDFVATIRARKYQGLGLTTMVIPGSGHSSSVPEGYLKGLRIVYNPPLD